MATLRPVEERDSKDRTLRLNPSITFKQDRQIRVITGRNDWRLDPNPDFHEPITAQVQDGKVHFFAGIPDNAKSRAAARELKRSDVPEYIVKALTQSPIRVKEHRPAVYEVKIALVGDVETTEVEELASADTAESVTVAPVVPDLSGKGRGGRPRRAAPVEEATT
jgi:hypothetical protein